MSEWQPIETAPRDGTDILTWRASQKTRLGVICGMHCGFWHPDMKEWQSSDLEWELLPTHWMPLPEPPE